MKAKLYIDGKALDCDVKFIDPADLVKVRRSTFEIVPFPSYSVTFKIKPITVAAFRQLVTSNKN